MVKRYGKDGAQVLHKALHSSNCHQNGFPNISELLFSTGTLFIFFFINTMLKSLLFNFLPSQPLYLICGILKRKTHLAKTCKKLTTEEKVVCSGKGLKESPLLYPFANCVSQRQLEYDRKNNPTIYLC